MKKTKRRKRTRNLQKRMKVRITFPYTVTSLEATEATSPPIQHKNAPSGVDKSKSVINFKQPLLIMGSLSGQRRIHRSFLDIGSSDEEPTVELFVQESRKKRTRQTATSSSQGKLTICQIRTSY